MRLVINNNDRISGTTHNFSVQLSLLPEDRNRTMKVYIKQVIVSSVTAIDDKILYLSSNNLIPVEGEYNTRYNGTLCFLKNEGSIFYYQNNDSTENFTIQGVNPILNFSINTLDNIDFTNDDFHIAIILNLI